MTILTDQLPIFRVLSCARIFRNVIKSFVMRETARLRLYIQVLSPEINQLNSQRLLMIPKRYVSIRHDTILTLPKFITVFTHTHTLLNASKILLYNMSRNGTIENMF